MIVMCRENITVLNRPTWMIFKANVQAVVFTVMSSVHRRQIHCYRVKELSLDVSQNKL
jgi:hypothetical protein